MATRTAFSIRKKSALFDRLCTPVRCPTTESFLCGRSSKTYILASLSGERCSGGQLLSTFSDLAGGLRVVRVCAALLGQLRGRNSCCLWFWQLVFGVSLRDATSNLLSSPNPLSNRTVGGSVQKKKAFFLYTTPYRTVRSVLHDWRKHKTFVFSQPNAIRE